MVCDLFIDPRLPTWEKELLTNGIESLIIHSSNYIQYFRPVALGKRNLLTSILFLECFDTYQLQPLHLSHALSIYLTCIYRGRIIRNFQLINLELHDATTTTPIESFKNEIQKILNMYTYFSLKNYF